MSSDDAAHPQSKAFLSNYHNYNAHRLDESCCWFRQSGTKTVNASGNFHKEAGGGGGGLAQTRQPFVFK